MFAGRKPSGVLVAGVVTTSAALSVLTAAAVDIVSGLVAKTLSRS